MARAGSRGGRGVRQRVLAAPAVASASANVNCGWVGERRGRRGRSTCRVWVGSDRSRRRRRSCRLDVAIRRQLGTDDRRCTLTSHATGVPSASSCCKALAISGCARSAASANSRGRVVDWRLVGRRGRRDEHDAGGKERACGAWPHHRPVAGLKSSHARLRIPVAQRSGALTQRRCVERADRRGDRCNRRINLARDPGQPPGPLLPFRLLRSPPRRALGSNAMSRMPRPTSPVGLYDPDIRARRLRRRLRGAPAAGSRRTRRSSGRSWRWRTSSTTARAGATRTPATAPEFCSKSPTPFFRKRKPPLGPPLPAAGEYGVAFCFLPTDAESRGGAPRAARKDRRPRRSGRPGCRTVPVVSECDRVARAVDQTEDGAIAHRAAGAHHTTRLPSSGTST